MKDASKEAINQIAMHPKTSSLIAFLVAYVNAWYVDWGEWMMSFLTTLFGLILVFVLIVKHIVDTVIALKKAKKDD